MKVTADTILGFKVCSKCNQILPKADFRGDVRHLDGLQSHCKWCQSDRARDCRKSHLKSYREREQKYRKRHPEVREKQQRDNPEQHSAINKLNYAITTGKVIRPNRCSVCGELCTPEGHHEDYSLPLAVIWMCRRCHARWPNCLKENDNE